MITNLPVELFWNCCNFLTLRDLSKFDVACLNKKQREIFLSYLTYGNFVNNLGNIIDFRTNFEEWIIDRKISLTTIETTDMSSFGSIHQMAKLSKYITHLSLGDIDWNKAYQFHISCLLNEVRHKIGMISVNCEKLDYSFIQMIGYFCSDIPINIRFDVTNQVQVDKSLTVISICFPFLQRLQIYGCCYSTHIMYDSGICKMLKGCKNIRELYIQSCGCASIDNDSTLIELSKAKNLEKIKISDSLFLTDYGFNELFTKQQNLTYVDISYNLNISDASISHVSNLKQLRYFICIETKCTAESLIKIVYNCPLLEVLNFKHCEYNDATILAIAKKGVNLVSLTFGIYSSNIFIEPSTMITLAQNCVNLEVLTVFNAGLAINDDFINVLSLYNSKITHLILPDSVISQLNVFINYFPNLVELCLNENYVSSEDYIRFLNSYPNTFLSCA